MTEPWVRMYHAWYRHITLAMLAHAWLAVTAAKTREQDPPERPPATRAVGYQREGRGLAIPEPAEPAGTRMIPFSLNEIRHVLALFGQAVIPPSVITWWSDWRRSHQARARYYHFRARIRANQADVTRAATT